MAFNQAAGTKIYIGTTASNHLTDTYSEIGEVTSIPQFGRVYNEVTFTALGNRNVRKAKGSRNDGNVTISYGYDADDTGQDALRTALDDDGDFNFRIDYPAPLTAKTYFKAKVMSAPKTIGSLDGVIMAETVLGIQSGSIVEVA